MKCKRCEQDVPSSARECPACGEDNGYPNVRMAERDEEFAALSVRLEQAEASATAANYIDVLNDFGTKILDSKMAIVRPLAYMLWLLESDKHTYSTYQLEVQMGARIPEENKWDLTRNQWEAALHPNFHKEIRYGCLTLNNKGLEKFGPYVMIMKDEMIAHRATVFEENPAIFVDRLGVLLNQPIPPGYRSAWEKRDVLAKSKLYHKLSAGTRPDDYPMILLDVGAGDKPADYIEVHLYGGFTQAAIESIAGANPETREDRIIWQRLGRLIAEIGGTQETI